MHIIHDTYAQNKHINVINIHKTYSYTYTFCRVYIGYDLGDLYFDQPAQIAGLAKYFEEEVAEPSRKRGIATELILQVYIRTYV